MKSFIPQSRSPCPPCRILLKWNISFTPKAVNELKIFSLQNKLSKSRILQILPKRIVHQIPLLLQGPPLSPCERSRMLRLTKLGDIKVAETLGNLYPCFFFSKNETLHILLELKQPTLITTIISSVDQYETLQNKQEQRKELKELSKVKIQLNHQFSYFPSFSSHCYSVDNINIFGDNKIHTNSSHNLFLFFQLIKKHLIILLRIKNKRNTLKSTIFTKVIHTDYREVAKNIFTPTT